MKKNIYILILLAFASLSNAQWVSQTNPLGNGVGLGKIQFVSSTEGWISAGKGNLLHTTNAGINWIIVNPFPNDTVMSMADPAITMWWVNQSYGWKINWPGTGFIDARGAVIHKTTNGGTSWQKVVLSNTNGELGLQVQFLDANTGWALIYILSNNTGRIMKSTNGGNNWSNLNATGEFGSFYFVDANNGWSIVSGSNSAPPYKITRTTNGGLNWFVQYTDNTQGSFSKIHMTDLNNGWIVGSSGKILKTNNGGINWTFVTNAGLTSTSKSKTLYFLNANTGWIANAEANWPVHKILQTTDGGNSWSQNIQSFDGSIFNIFFWDANNGWYSGEQCVANCNGPDSLMIWHGIILRTTSGGIGVRQISTVVPSYYSLRQNYPNPFNPNTVIKFQIKDSKLVTLRIYNVLGKGIATLVNEKLAPGTYEATFDASAYPSGVYFYRMNAGDFSETKKMLMIK